MADEFGRISGPGAAPFHPSLGHGPDGPMPPDLPAHLRLANELQDRLGESQERIASLEAQLDDARRVRAMSEAALSALGSFDQMPSKVGLP